MLASIAKSVAAPLAAFALLVGAVMAPDSDVTHAIAAKVSDSCTGADRRGRRLPTVTEHTAVAVHSGRGLGWCGGH